MASIFKPIIVRSLVMKSLYKPFCYSYYDPPYLDSLKPQIPIYDSLNVQFKGYDFASLESVQKVIHKIAMVMDINVEDGWATPSTRHKIQRFKPSSTVIDSEYILSTYERNLLISELPSTKASIFFEIIQNCLPQGVSVNVQPYLPEDDKKRFVPDFELKQLKTQLENLGGPSKKK